MQHLKDRGPDLPHLIKRRAEAAPQRAEIDPAAGLRRGADRDQRQIAAAQRRGRVGGRPQASAVDAVPDQAIQPGLDHR